MKTNTIHTGDVFDRLPELPAESVHTVMTSPPYWNLRDYGEDDQLGLEETPEEFVENLADVFDEVKRVLRPDGSLWLNLGDTYHNKDLQQIPARVALELQNRGWILRNRVTWAKPNPMPQSVKDRLNDTTEAVFHFVKNKEYCYDLDAIREAHAKSTRERMGKGYKNATEGQRTKSDTPGDHHRSGGCHEPGIGFDETLNPAGKNPGDVFEVTTKPFPEAHFAVYPPELCEKPIKATCPPKVCAECGTPYEKKTKERLVWEMDKSEVNRRQQRRVIEIYNNSELTEEHMRAVRRVGSAAVSSSAPERRLEQDGDLPANWSKLAAEAKDILGSYFEHVDGHIEETTGWRQPCDCDTDATEPGIALDPFAGAGTTLLKAKELGRKFVGVELNPEYADMARARIGLTPNDPSRIRDDDGQAGFEAYTD